MFNATFIVAGISFVIFTIIMNFIFYKPIADIVKKRQEFIDTTNEEAKLNREKSDAILKEKEQKIGTSKSDAKKIIAETSDNSKQEKANLAKNAQSKAISEINSAKDSLNNDKNNAQIALADSVVDLANNISSKLLGENVQASDADKELINNILREGD
ncbi:ATP synthase F0 subunit B [bacterium]|nr:ATP synthase F0 subunit B [bacterium]